MNVNVNWLDEPAEENEYWTCEKCGCTDYRIPVDISTYPMWTESKKQDAIANHDCKKALLEREQAHLEDCKADCRVLDQEIAGHLSEKNKEK